LRNKSIRQRKGVMRRKRKRDEKKKKKRETREGRIRRMEG
jgi:hypothetical protein